VFCPEEEMAGAWKETANRGFYYGPKSNNAWNNDSGWKNCIKKENQLAAKSLPPKTGKAIRTDAFFQLDLQYFRFAPDY